MSNSTPEIKQYIRKKLYEDYNQGTQIDLQNAAIEAERKKKDDERPSGSFWDWVFGSKESIEQETAFEVEKHKIEFESAGHGQRLRDGEAKRYKDLAPSTTTPGTTTPGKIIQTDTEAERLEASKSTLNPPVSDESSFTTAMRQANNRHGVGGYLSSPNPVESAENVEKVDYQGKYDMNDETTFGQPRLGSSETNYNSQANINTRDIVKKEQKTRADSVYNPADIEVLKVQAGAKKVVPLTPEEEAEKQKRAGVQSSADTRVLQKQAGAKKPPRRGLRGLGVVEEFKRVVPLGTKGPSFKALLEKTRSR